MTTFSERIKLALEAKGINQSELARRLGVTRAAVSVWCSSSAKDLNASNALLIAQELDVDPYWLVFGKGHMRAHKLGKTALEIVATVQEFDEATQELASRLIKQLQKTA